MMNKSGIPWCDFSWNPITGCKKKCNDCFAHKIAKRLSGSIRINIGSSDIQKDLKNRLFILEKPFHSERGTVSLFPAGFDPTFHRYRLSMISYKQKPANIFVGSIGDMFDASVPTEWITAVFDACKKANQENYDILICDTAGRLQTKVNLMNELAKIRRVIGKEIPDGPHEVLLVIDATTGQNGVFQAKAFAEATGVNGIVLTKMDGTSKGGIILAIKSSLGIPVKFIDLSQILLNHPSFHLNQ